MGTREKSVCLRTTLCLRGALLPAYRAYDIIIERLINMYIKDLSSETGPAVPISNTIDRTGTSRDATARQTSIFSPIISRT